MNKKSIHLSLLAGILFTTASASVQASCPVPHHRLKTVLMDSIFPVGGVTNGGLDFHMWATVVTADGTVCNVVRSGNRLSDQWLGSRVISAQKANTAIAFSKSDLAISTGNLWAPTQPGGSLFGLQFSNPVDTSKAYRGSSSKYGSRNDPMRNHKVGGVNVFGGGLALYNETGKMVGAIGVSGDTSCADHNVAWRVRRELGLDHVPAGVSSNGDDNIVYDLDMSDKSSGGFGHPECSAASTAIAESFPRAGTEDF